jgi:hypothetical protein
MPQEPPRIPEFDGIYSRSGNIWSCYIRSRSFVSARWFLLWLQLFSPLSLSHGGSRLSVVVVHVHLYESLNSWKVIERIHIFVRISLSSVIREQLIYVPTCMLSSGWSKLSPEVVACIAVFRLQPLSYVDEDDRLPPNVSVV